MTVLMLDGGDLGCVIDDDGAVDVAEDHVFRRTRHISRPMTPHWNWHEYRDRQRKNLDGWRRWRQHDEIRRRWRQEIDGKRRRGCEVVGRIGEYERWPVDIGELLGWRRRHVIVDR
jgi:hypothetical protein